MRAVICDAFGPAENLQLKDLPTPEPGPGEVRVAIEGCGVNFFDTLIIKDMYQIKPQPPFSPGGEVAGIVEAVGEGVDAALIGQPVMALTQYGGYASHTIVPAKALLMRPASMPGDIAAGFTITYGTSMHALKQRGQLQAGETLLVLGASGGVGLAAVEIGVQMGARVIAAASSDEKLEICREAGAHEFINYGRDDLRTRIKEITGGAGVDVTYDPVGGPMFEQALRSTAFGGRVLVVGFASGEIPKIPANLPLLKSCAVVGVFWGDFRVRFVEDDNANFDELFAWYEDGGLRPHVSARYALEDYKQALDDLSARRAVGKIVLMNGTTDGQHSAGMTEAEL